MIASAVHCLWRDPQQANPFHTGICLHGHTMHSEECLSFLPRYLHSVPGISQIASHYERGPKRADFARAYWTPPLSPASALKLEREQILGLGLQPVVSLTDHDSVEAGISLQVTADPAQVPVSVEWTVPYRRSILHLGMHNLPPQGARGWMERMAQYTAAPDETKLRSILRDFAAIPETLIVFNHPFWLEEGVEAGDHQRALEHFLPESLAWIHAFELNGTRPWKENGDVIGLARTWSRPVISGGDRHASEPAACINLTNARSFAEFAAEIRAGCSSVLFLPQYREPMAVRVLEAAWDILKPYPEYPGRERWTDRCFYRPESGEPKSLAELWGNRVPLPLQGATAVIQFFATSKLRLALRSFLAERGEMLS